jgi:hypothetical protein
MSSGGGSLGIGSDGGVEIEKCACMGRFSGVGIDGGGGVDVKGGGMVKLKSACGWDWCGIDARSSVDGLVGAVWN